jgi:hypothetical protein
MSLSQALDSQDGFLDLCAFLLQFSEHLQNIHAESISQESQKRWRGSERANVSAG